MQSFGYTTETMQFMLRPMIEQKRDPVGSMGNDSALAVLSDQPRLTYDYFKQLFAQVTNPPIDSIREEVIMGVECYIGPEQNLLTTTPEHAHRLRIPHPILTNEEVRSLKTIDERGWRTKLIDITWPRSEGAEGLEPRSTASGKRPSSGRRGYSLVVLTDRASGQDRIPVSALLATGAVHHHLVAPRSARESASSWQPARRERCSIIAVSSGYGADAINPYLAFESLWQSAAGQLDAERFPTTPASSTAIARRWPRACSRCSARWGSRRSSRTRARRSSKRWA